MVESTASHLSSRPALLVLDNPLRAGGASLRTDQRPVFCSTSLVTAQDMLYCMYSCAQGTMIYDERLAPLYNLVQYTLYLPFTPSIYQSLLP